MKKMKFTAFLLSSAILLGSCSTMNNTTKGGIIGGGSGAAAGAIIGGLFGRENVRLSVPQWVPQWVRVQVWQSVIRWTRKLPKPPKLKVHRWKW